MADRTGPAPDASGEHCSRGADQPAQYDGGHSHDAGHCSQATQLVNASATATPPAWVTLHWSSHTESVHPPMHSHRAPHSGSASQAAFAAAQGPSYAHSLHASQFACALSSHVAGPASGPSSGPASGAGSPQSHTPQPVPSSSQTWTPSAAPTHGQSSTRPGSHTGSGSLSQSAAALRAPRSSAVGRVCRAGARIIAVPPG